ncbi:MAG: universal stress protein [Deltaproteobacteria bacterium]|nr:universal stress protein [Deltaproteobacteria bacterium]
MVLEDKILVAVDGSDRCMETIKHIAQRDPFQKKHLVLYHVFIALPDFYWDIEMEPQSRGAVAHVRAWEAAKKNEIEQFMKKARQILMDAGFPKEAVTVKIKQSEKGIARDIVEEAKSGYLAVIISRSGEGEMPEPFLGTNAVKVIQKLSFVPVFIAGKRLPGKNILVAVDRSEGAMRAVDFVGKLMGGHDFTVTLLHVIRNEVQLKPGAAYKPLPKEEIETEEQKFQAVFDEAKRRLIDHGFTSDQVTQKTITGASSQPRVIVQEAEQGRHSPIVIGRRGLSKFQEFFMGSVSNRVIQLGVEQAVWVVT